jgi:hypothetical protein
MKMSKTIRITCQAAATVTLDRLLPLQGTLKALPEENHARLRTSILKHGITFPFFVWRKRGKYFIIDAHQRDKVLQRLGAEGWTIPPVPVAWIEARDEREAREKILLCNSQYGQMTVSSLGEFLTINLIEAAQLKNETAGLPFPQIDLTAPILQPLAIQPPPKMAWTLIGIPIQHFAAVQALIDQLPEAAQVHTTANDNEGDQD